MTDEVPETGELKLLGVPPEVGNVVGYTEFIGTGVIVEVETAATTWWGADVSDTDALLLGMILCVQNESQGIAPEAVTALMRNLTRPGSLGTQRRMSRATVAKYTRVIEQREFFFVCREKGKYRKLVVPREVSEILMGHPELSALQKAGEANGRAVRTSKANSALVQFTTTAAPYLAAARKAAEENLKVPGETATLALRMVQASLKIADDAEARTKSGRPRTVATATPVHNAVSEKKLNQPVVSSSSSSASAAPAALDKRQAQETTPSRKFLEVVPVDYATKVRAFQARADYGILTQHHRELHLRRVAEEAKTKVAPVTRTIMRFNGKRTFVYDASGIQVPSAPAPTAPVPTPSNAAIDVTVTVPDE